MYAFFSRRDSLLRCIRMIGTDPLKVNVLFMGVSNIFWVPLSNWAGRRPILLVATLLMTMSCMWAGLATSYESLLAARVFQGIGAGASETVAPAMVGDVYFLHERGRAMVGRPAMCDFVDVVNVD